MHVLALHLFLTLSPPPPKNSNKIKLNRLESSKALSGTVLAGDQESNTWSVHVEEQAQWEGNTSESICKRTHTAITTVQTMQRKILQCTFQKFHYAHNRPIRYSTQEGLKLHWTILYATCSQRRLVDEMSTSWIGSDSLNTHRHTKAQVRTKGFRKWLTLLLKWKRLVTSRSFASLVPPFPADVLLVPSDGLYADWHWEE